jgi:hypothetical protein
LVKLMVTLAGWINQQREPRLSGLLRYYHRDAA